MSHFVLRVWILVCLFHVFVFTQELKVHQRSKRYLVFPKGSNLFMTMVMSKILIFEFPKNFNSLIEFDILFPLPNITHKERKHEYKWPTHHSPLPSNYYNLPHQRDYWSEHRRQKREIYRQLETILLSQDINGPACIRRFLCEISHLDKHPLKGSLFHDWMEILFRYTDNENWMNEDDSHYNMKNCFEEKLVDCAFQFRDFADWILKLFLNNIK